MADGSIVKTTVRKKRSKIAIVLLSPILVFTFIVGWCLYWIGQSRQPKIENPQQQIIKIPVKQDGIELDMIPQDQKQVVQC
jgi:flagellar basal body-associated protein FliL